MALRRHRRRHPHPHRWRTQEAQWRRLVRRPARDAPLAQYRRAAGLRARRRAAQRPGPARVARRRQRRRRLPQAAAWERLGPRALVARPRARAAVAAAVARCGAGGGGD